MEETKNQLNITLLKLNEAEEKLKKLNELKIKLAGEEWGDIKEKKKWETEVFILEEEKEDLKRRRDEWEKQLRNLQNKAAEFDEKGNE
jgi:hypothetical protein